MLHEVGMREFRPENFVYDAEDIPFGTLWWFLYAGISCLLVLFAGIMSGLTLGLMSLGLVDLEILQRSGSSTEKKQAGTTKYYIMLTSLFCCFCLTFWFTLAAAILPVVQKQHQLLVTLLLCNACAMEVFATWFLGILILDEMGLLFLYKKIAI